MSRAEKYRRAGRGASRVTATDAAKHFGRLVDRVREDRATYVVERGGQPVARIGPVERASFTMSDFKDLARGLPGVGEEYPDLVERAVARHSRPRIRRNPWER